MRTEASRELVRGKQREGREIVMTRSKTGKDSQDKDMDRYDMYRDSQNKARGSQDNIKDTERDSKDMNKDSQDKVKESIRSKIVIMRVGIVMIRS